MACSAAAHAVSSASLRCVAPAYPPPAPAAQITRVWMCARTLCQVRKYGGPVIRERVIIPDELFTRKTFFKDYVLPKAVQALPGAPPAAAGGAPAAQKAAKGEKKAAKKRKGAKGEAATAVRARSFSVCARLHSLPRRPLPLLQHGISGHGRRSPPLAATLTWRAGGRRVSVVRQRRRSSARSCKGTRNR